LCFELFGSAAGIRSDGTALRLLNRDGTIHPVNFGNRSRKRLLGQSRRADMVRAEVPAKMIFAIFMAVSRFLNASRRRALRH
jgi:hypothetical protein